MDGRFGERLRAERQARDMSQSHVLLVLEASHGIKWHQSTMTKVEAGTRPVRLFEALALASVLHVDLADLLDDPQSQHSADRRDLHRKGRLDELAYLSVQVRHRYASIVEQSDGSGRADSAGSDGSPIEGRGDNDGEHQEAP